MHPARAKAYENIAASHGKMAGYYIQVALGVAADEYLTAAHAVDEAVGHAREAWHFASHLNRSFRRAWRSES